jgi:hypothetical protein
MRNVLNIIACSALAVAVSYAAVVADETHKHGHDHDAMTKEGGKETAAGPAIFTGEVIDLTCYTSHPETGSGPEHASCAKSCLEKGLPAGLLVGDRLYTVVMSDHSAPSKSLAAHAGQVVNVKGTATQSHGSWFLAVSSIEHAAKPEAKAK